MQIHNPPPDADTFRMVAETRRRLAEIALAARNAIRTHYTDPDCLADFVESHQTDVYVLKGWLPVFCLWALGFEPGFIPPGGLRYQLLQRGLRLYGRLSGRKSSAGKSLPKSGEYGVFVLTPPLFTVGFLSHQLHHWLAFRAGLDGYGQRAQKLYRQFWNEHNGAIGDEVYQMRTEDIIALKAAINRDLEALQFLKVIASEVLIPARQAQRIAAGKASA